MVVSTSEPLEDRVWTMVKEDRPTGVAVWQTEPATLYYTHFMAR